MSDDPIENLRAVAAAGRSGDDPDHAQLADTISQLDGVAARPRDAGRAQHQAGLDAYRPVERPNGELYYPREVPHTGMTDVELLRMARTATNNPDRAQRRELYTLLDGPPGGGKTSLVEAAFGDELLTIHGTGETTTADMIGTFTPDEDHPTGYRWIERELVQAMREGRPLFIDDATLIPPPVMARMYPAIDGRRRLNVTEHRGEQIVAQLTTEASEGFFVVLAHNPGTPGAILTDPLNSRCTLKLHVSTDYDLARHLGCSSASVQLAQRLEERRLDPQDDLEWSMQMRELIAFRNAQQLWGEKAAAANMLAGIMSVPDRVLVAEEVQQGLGFSVERLHAGTSKYVGAET